jgi:hypothetical protein
MHFFYLNGNNEFNRFEKVERIVEFRFHWHCIDEIMLAFDDSRILQSECLY